MTKHFLKFLRCLLPSAAVLRVTVYGFFVFLLVAFFGGRLLYADVREAALAAGHEIARLEGLSGKPETILVNGARLRHSSVYTAESVTTVLDRFEAYCKDGALFDRVLVDLPKQFESKFGEGRIPDSLRWGIAREESKDKSKGMVACFVDDGEKGGLRGLTDKVKAFLKTRNLREFGAFRYAIAERASSGETHVMALWGDGDLKVAEMFPARGDAPGADSSIVDRPPETRRILAAAAEGMPYAVRIYESTHGSEELRRFFDTSMAAKGWRLVLDVPAQANTSVYVREDGLLVFVSVSEAKKGRALATVVEGGRGDRSSTATVQLSR